MQERHLASLPLPWSGGAWRCMLRAEFTPRITLPAFTTVHTSTGHFPAFQPPVLWCGVDTSLLSAVCRLAILLVHMHVCDEGALVPLHTPLASGHIALWPTTCDYAVQVSTFGMVVRGPFFSGLACWPAPTACSAVCWHIFLLERRAAVRNGAFAQLLMCGV